MGKGSAAVAQSWVECIECGISLDFDQALVVAGGHSCALCDSEREIHQLNRRSMRQLAATALVGGVMSLGGVFSLISGVVALFAIGAMIRHTFFSTLEARAAAAEEAIFMVLGGLVGLASLSTSVPVAIMLIRLIKAG